MTRQEPRPPRKPSFGTASKNTSEQFLRGPKVSVARSGKNTGNARFKTELSLAGNPASALGRDRPCRSWVLTVSRQQQGDLHMFGLLDRGFRSSTPRTTRRSAPRRRQRTNLLLERLEDRTVLSSLTLTGSSGINAAKVVFDQPGGTGAPLTVTLTNTAITVFNNTNQLTPTNVLTGVLFDVPGSTPQQ